MAAAKDICSKVNSSLFRRRDAKGDNTQMTDDFAMVTSRPAVSLGKHPNANQLTVWYSTYGSRHPTYSAWDFCQTYF